MATTRRRAASRRARRRGCCPGVAGSQGMLRPAAGSHRHDVAIDADREQPRPGRTERRWHVGPGAHHDERGDRRREQQRGQREHANGQRRLRERRQPAVEREPAGPAPRRGRGRGDGLDEAGGSGLDRVGGEPGGEEAVDVVGCGHATGPSTSREARASASRTARIALVARWSRDFAVPTGTPMASAVSSIVRSR